MKIIVLGAGVIGVTTAWYLAEAGHQVTVIDRQKSVGLETSLANGGQISVSHAMPWANPSAPIEFIKSLFDPEAPLLYHWRFDRDLWLWSLQFLRQCFPQQTKENTEIILKLALESRKCLLELRQKLPQLNYHQLKQGILHFATTKHIYAALINKQKICPKLNSDYSLQILNKENCLKIEPALANFALSGGVYAPLDESGDAHLFTCQLAELAKLAGVNFIFQQQIENLQITNNSITGVWLREIKGDKTSGNREINDLLSLQQILEDKDKYYNISNNINSAKIGEKHLIEADAFVLALGSTSRQIGKMAKLDLTIYPAKGYSVSFNLNENDFTNAKVPTVSLLDEERKIVFSRLGNVLRVAGTAEFCGYDYRLNIKRILSITNRSQQLFPFLKEITAEKIDCWSGLRPLTPSNIPYVGKSEINNLWLNCGHGTLGWTLACGSAERITKEINKT